MVAIFHPLSPENDGFIGYLSTSDAFGGDIVSERGFVHVYVSACLCVLRPVMVNDK